MEAYILKDSCIRNEYGLAIKKRYRDCTQKVYIVVESPAKLPDGAWERVDYNDTATLCCSHLYTVDGVRYFGYM